MKTVILISIFLTASLIVSGQGENIIKNCDTIDCNSILITQYDKMTGKSVFILKSEFIFFDVNDNAEFTITLEKMKGYYPAIKAYLPSVCVDNKNEILFLFRDGTRGSIENYLAYNCQGSFYAFLNSLVDYSNVFDDLKIKEIESIRIEVNSRNFQTDLTPDQSKMFMKAVNCMREQKIGAPK